MRSTFSWSPEEVHRGHAGDRGQLGGHLVLGDPGQRLLGQALADHRQADDRPGVGIGLHHGHVLDAVGQVALDPGHRLAHVIGGDVKVYVGVELGAQAGVVLLAGGVDRLDPGDPGHGALDHAGDLGVHGLRRGAVEEHTDRHHRAVDVRQLAHLDPEQRAQAGDHDQEVQHHDQGRAPDRQGR